MADSKHLSKIRPRGWVSLSFTFCKELINPDRNGLPFCLPPKDILSWFRNNRYWGRRPDPIPPALPWLNYNLLRWVEERGPRSVFEWGSGASTIWFSRLSTSPSVVSVESDPKWHSVVQASLHEAHLQAKVYLCPDKPAYLEAFRLSGILPPDLILIDGVWREDCLEVALPYVKQGTCIIFHDTQAKPYQKVIRHLPDGVKRRDFYGPCWGIKNFRGWTLLEGS
jgi:hypothetical protein